MQPSAAGANGKVGAAQRASPAGNGGARDAEQATTRATRATRTTTAVTSWRWRKVRSKRAEGPLTHFSRPRFSTTGGRFVELLERLMPLFRISSSFQYKICLSKERERNHGPDAADCRSGRRSLPSAGAEKPTKLNTIHSPGVREVPDPWAVFPVLRQKIRPIRAAQPIVDRRMVAFFRGMCYSGGGTGGMTP